MAYLRDEKEKIEIDYPLDKIWAAIPKVAETLEWTVEEKNDAAHSAKIKTKGGFLAYSTVIKLEAKSVNEKTTQMVVTAETPVTTITSIVDFGRTADRMGIFIDALAKFMENKKKET